jgi:hypothetical protein
MRNLRGISASEHADSVLGRHILKNLFFRNNSSHYAKPRAAVPQGPCEFWETPPERRAGCVPPIEVLLWNYWGFVNLRAALEEVAQKIGVEVSGVWKK